MTPHESSLHMPREGFGRSYWKALTRRATWKLQTRLPCSEQDLGFGLQPRLSHSKMLLHGHQTGMRALAQSQNCRRCNARAAAARPVAAALRSYVGFHRHSLTAAAPSFHARVQHQISGGRAAATPSRNSTRAVTRAMFERFTEKAIKVVMLAQEEARRLGHNFVGTEQILLGLIGESTGIAAKVLKSMGVNLKEARVEVEKIIGRGSGFVAVEIPFTPRAKRVLELSLEEARQLGGWPACTCM